MVKTLVELEDGIQFIKFLNDHYNDENKNIDGIRRLFDVFKPKKADDGFGVRRNNYIKYISEGDEYKNLSPEEYLDITRPYLKELINDHSHAGEWKIQLVMLNRCISSRNFKEMRSVYSASDNIEI